MPTPLARDQLTPESAGLLAVDTENAGWRRQPCGKGFSYKGLNGSTLSGASRERCEALAVPPAWEDVWICPDPKGHIQAYGTDPAGRRQYVYHEDWRKTADLAKYDDLSLFAERLPRLRRRVTALLKAREDTPDTITALIVRLIDRAGLRIGSRRARRQSGTIGATTLQAQHVSFDGEDGLSLDFTAKGGRNRTLVITDAVLIEAIRDLLEEGDSGRVFRHTDHVIGPSEVNDFIGEGMDAGFTARDFRTWGGSVAATGALWRMEERTISGIAEAASDWLGNTPAIAQNSYIHPAIVDAARRDGCLPDPAGPNRLRLDERRTYALIS